MEISAEINSLREKTLHLTNDRLYRPRADAVFAVRHSVFKNVNRLPESSKVLHRLAQAFRVDLAVRDFNAGISLGLVRRNGYLEEQRLRASALKSHAQPAVIIDPHK